MSNEVTICTFDDFIKNNPDMAHLDPMNQIDFSLSDINQDELEILKVYFSEICIDLTLYMQLFSEENSIKQINKFNPLVFHRIEKAYLEKICLQISTLMDPPQSCGNQNLSLQRFIKQTKSLFLQEKFEQLKNFYESSGIRDWRNKVLAHADLNTISGANQIHINFNRDDVDNFVSKMQNFIDWISDPRASTDHKVVLPRDKDGYAFIRKLREHNES